MALINLVSFLLMGFLKIWPGVFAILLQQVTRGLYRPVTTKYLNKHIPSDKRATVLSFQSLCANIAVAVAFPFMGMMRDANDIFTTHLILAVILGVALVPLKWYMDKNMGGKREREAKVPGAEDIKLLEISRKIT